MHTWASKNLSLVVPVFDFFSFLSVLLTVNLDIKLKKHIQIGVSFQNSYHIVIRMMKSALSF